MENDFINNPKYPGYGIYQRRFGSFQKGLKLVGLDFDTVTRNGIIENNKQKGRLFEICVLEHFENKSKDLSGENQNSPCDGICPKGHIYDVKSSKLYNNRYYMFNTRNKFREEIEHYYFGGFNSDWTMPEHVWRVSGEIVEKDYFIVGLNSGYMYNVENMKEYEITDKFKYIDIFK